MKKKIVKTCLIYTLVFYVIYNGLIGISIADEWGVSPIAAFFGNILGGNDLYPMDLIGKITIILLIIEIILLIKYSSNKEITKKEKNENSFDNLERLKDLLDKKIITEEEFENKKKEILKKM